MSEKTLSISLLLPAGASLAGKLSHELIEHLPVGVYLCDAAGVVVAYNHKAADIWGEAPNLGESQIKYCGAHKLLTPDGVHIPHEQTPLAEILVTQKAITNFRTIVERRDGSRVPVLANIVPLFDNTGTMAGFMNSVQDLRQQVEEQTTKQHLEDALFQSQKMDVVGQITSGLAHDFNNQLASLSMAFGLLEKEVATFDSERAARFLDVCQQSIKRASSLAEDLLNFSRNRPKRLDRVDPNEAVQAVAPLIRSALGVKVSLDLALTPDTCFFEANKQELESALLNLAINARDAMIKGGTLTIATQNVELDNSNIEHDASFEPGKYVLLSVRDTGQGMDADTLLRIFTPFFTTKEPGKGTGLGLAMVRGFVTDVNGQITVESELGKGTYFGLYFPAYGTGHSMDIKGSQQ